MKRGLGRERSTDPTTLVQPIGALSRDARDVCREPCNYRHRLSSGKRRREGSNAFNCTWRGNNVVYMNSTLCPRDAGIDV